ncbi:MAG: right-handed parallel beta-helix repeat-containing protein, partial [Bacteroidota bacterium]|nr:right-handed parallel beta-helix repeat-containing protein [Bacteroidota bacterium]
GNYLILRHSARDHAGTFIIDSKNVTIENLNMYQNGGLGILSQFCENLTFKHVNCVPNLAKNRYFAGHDDGIHCWNDKGLILVDSCRFLGLMDDPINVGGTYVIVKKKIDGKTLKCRFNFWQCTGLTWGHINDIIGFIERQSMQTIAEGTIKKFQCLDRDEFVLEFYNPVPAEIKEGDVLENLTWSPDVTIQNSKFGSCRARGILVSTPGKVLIDKNEFESNGSAILITGDVNQWMESGGVKDILIRNNTFNDPCMTGMYEYCEGIISIFPNMPKPDENKPFHRNIRIENNVFHPFDYSVLYARSSDGLSFKGNTLIRSQHYQPFHQRKYTFTFEYCRNVKILDNKLKGEILGRNIKLVSTPVQQLILDRKQGLVIEKQ